MCQDLFWGLFQPGKMNETHVRASERASSPLDPKVSIPVAPLTELEDVEQISWEMQANPTGGTAWRMLFARFGLCDTECGRLVA